MLKKENRLFSRKVKNTFLFVLFIALLIYPNQKVKAAENPLFYTLKVVNTKELTYPIFRLKTEEEPLLSVQKVTNIEDVIYTNQKMKSIEYFGIDSQEIKQYYQKSLEVIQMREKQIAQKELNDILEQFQFTMIETTQQLEQSNEENFEKVQKNNNSVKENEEKFGEYFLTPQSAIEYTEEDIELLAKVIYAEAGVCDEMEKYRVGNVVLNRVNDETNEFENSIEGVIYQDGQFTSVGGTNWQHGPTEIRIATELLEGKRIFPEYIVWFSKKCNYGKVYYTSEWHEFSGWELN